MTRSRLGVMSDRSESLLVLMGGAAMVVVGTVLTRLRAWEGFARFTARVLGSRVGDESAVRLFTIVARAIRILGLAWVIVGIVALLNS